MFLKILGYLGMAVAAGLLVQTMVTTYYLAKIDSGLNTSLDSTGSLITIQEAIIDKNHAVKDVITTTKQMDKQLEGTLAVTQGIRTNIKLINDFNAATLDLNQNMVTSGSASGQSLQTISSGMGQLKQSTEQLFNALVNLNQITTQDRNNLRQMKSYTEQMNNKIPGVLP